MSAIRTAHAAGRRLAAANTLLFAVCLAQFMVILDVAVVTVALPSMRDDLGFSTTGLQWVVNAYTITFAGFLMLGARSADLLGRRRTFAAGTALFALASLVCALATSKGLLIGARALQGFGGAVVSPATLAIITASLPEGPERNRGLAAWGAVGGLGASSGALIGGVLTQALGWPAVFSVNVPVGLVVLVLARRVIPADERGRGARHFDLLGAVLMTAGLVALTYGTVRTGALGWTSAGVLVPLGAGAALLGAFGWFEGRVSRAPLVPLSIFRLRALRAANLVVVLLYFAMFSSFFFVTLYVQEVLGDGALVSGLSFLPITLAVFTGSSLAPRVVARIGLRPTLVAGMVLVASGLALLTDVRPDGSYAADVLPGGVISGLGMGLALVSATIAATQGVPKAQSGLASGLLNTSRLLGGALGLAVLTTIAAGAAHGADGLSDGFALAYVVGAGVALAGAAVALRLPSAGARPVADALVSEPAEQGAPAR